MGLLDQKAAENADLLDTLVEIERRVLWLAMRMVDFANNERGDSDIKVGGHQASSASMVSILTALWFGFLEKNDRVSVKPHASPVFHAIQYLLGTLERRYLPTLRAFGGLQSYPSQSKDPDVVHFSTGSVGLGAAAPLFAAVTDRYLRSHGWAQNGDPGRFIALVGDAELDEGNVWEAVGEPAAAGLGNVLWIVDLNRQSLDRVVPAARSNQLASLFRDSGWHVIDARYGLRLQSEFDSEGGRRLQRHLEHMSNEEFQSLLGAEEDLFLKQLLSDASPDLVEAYETRSSAEIKQLVQDVGGHDHHVLLEAFQAADAVKDRPSIVFAHTVKGWGLPFAGDPLNHSALLSADQIQELRRQCGIPEGDEWPEFDLETPAGQLCQSVGERLQSQQESREPAQFSIPASLGSSVGRRSSTQETFGRILMAMRSLPELDTRVVTVSPDVAVSTNLGGWINRVGVFADIEAPDHFGSDRILRWRPSPAGQHIELGISEMNLCLMLGQLGQSYEQHGELLFPVGTIYDPFIARGLDGLIYSLYCGARFLIAGTPSGVTLSYEGGAHQSTITPSIGISLPRLLYAEPAYGQALEWLFTRSMRRIAERAKYGSTYLRLTTRPIDQEPFNRAVELATEEAIRRHVLSGGYRLREPSSGGPLVVLAASGAVMPEVLAAAGELEHEGLSVLVLDVVSADQLFREWTHRMRSRRRGVTASSTHLEGLIRPHERDAPIVTVHDAHPSALGWLGSVFGQRVTPIGVTDFGQSGSVSEVYELFDLMPGYIVNAAIDAVNLRTAFP